MLRSARSTGRGFTITEVVVVIGIVAILVAILLPSLAAVRRRANKAEETNNIRQVGIAWTAYAGNHNDACLPGYLTSRVQQKWSLAAEYPDQTDIPPAPGYDGENVAGPWTWRLLSYLGYNLEIIRSHLRDGSEIDHATLRDGDAWLTDRTLSVALEPGFGYNGYYLGGSWEMYDINGNVRAKPRYFDVVDATNAPVTPIALNLGGIRKSSEMVAFCSATQHARPGVFGRDGADMAAGTHLVSPPFLGQRAIWQRPGAGFGDGGMGQTGATSGSVYDIETLVPGASVPLGRYNGQSALFFADGHTGTDTAAGLFDQRRWLNDTREVDGVLAEYFQHSETTWRLAE